MAAATEAWKLAPEMNSFQQVRALSIQHRRPIFLDGQPYQQAEDHPRHRYPNLQPHFPAKRHKWSRCDWHSHAGDKFVQLQCARCLFLERPKHFAVSHQRFHHPRRDKLFYNGFDGPRWADDAFIGDPSRSSLRVFVYSSPAAFVPEPEEYALIFGVFALGFVIARRHRQKRRQARV